MTDTSKIKMNRIDDGVEPGDLTYSLRTYKNGWLLCDGQEVSRTDYADLFEIIGTTFGSGNGTTTFNVPNYKGKFLQMINDNQSLGQEIEAGLPNIVGKFSGKCILNDSIQYSGALYEDNTYTTQLAGGTSGNHTRGIGFNASKSNTIYGKSNTVQPPASLVNYFIKY